MTMIPAENGTAIATGRIIPTELETVSTFSEKNSGEYSIDDYLGAIQEQLNQ